MAAVEVTISGVLYDKQWRTARPVVLIGEAMLSGLGVGGGPVIPPEGGGPPGIWGPTDPRPGWGLPGEPPGIWGPTDPRPGGGPIIPPEPTEPPPDGADKPPPEDGGWGFVAEWSKWGYFPAPDEAQPKAQTASGRRRR